mmetsp:Transcript_48765/g.120933  ORF Transcript_48765/g.120933 Transcript_48765/m.120933 type:complete len:279 (+) Transcript_48765:1803-2639(+)
MAMSHSEEPRERRLEKDSWPGVSMIITPGTFTWMLRFTSSEPMRSRRVSAGKKEAPICCVMPPASPSCTWVRRMLSSSFVFPVSTCPIMHTIVERSRSGVIVARAAAARCSRSARAFALSVAISSSSPSSSSEESESFSSPLFSSSSSGFLKLYSLSKTSSLRFFASSCSFCSAAIRLDHPSDGCGTNSSSSDHSSPLMPDAMTFASMASSFRLSHSCSSSGSAPASPPAASAAAGAFSTCSPPSCVRSAASPSAPTASPSAPTSSPSFFGFGFFRFV